MHEKFKTAIQKAADRFRSRVVGECVGILTHNDTDGATSAAIAVRALCRLGVNFHLSFISREISDISALIAEKPYKIFLLLDYGGHEAGRISAANPEKEFFILDHHLPAKVATKSEKVTNINPHFFGLDGGTDVCAASIVYLFVRALDEKNRDLAPLAIVGAIGDSQRKNDEFSSINEEIFQEGKAQGLLELKRGLNFYGWSTRPLHKALEYSTEPFIPGISGSESSAVQFLQELGLELKNADGSWKTLTDLNDDEKKALASAIILRLHKDTGHPERIFGQKIFLPKFRIAEVREAEVLSTLLNSCAKLGNFSLALGVALENAGCWSAAFKTVDAYKKKLIDSLTLFYNNLKNPAIVKETEQAIYFFGKEAVDPNLTSTISTILAHNLAQSGKCLFVLASLNGKTKVSARVIRKSDINLGELCSKLASDLGGEGGGHRQAAGAVIPTQDIEKLTEKVEQELRKK